MVLGGKAAECFIWSAAHDEDAEFVQRYGEPLRAAWMIKRYREDPACAAATP